MFKDHLIKWVLAYIHLVHTPKDTLEIIEDIDHWYDIPLFFALRLIKWCDFRILAVSPFPGLCRFADGCDFKQRTGDDSKTLMKVCTCGEYPIESGILTISFEVFLGAIAGYVPSAMVRCVAAFMNTCYVAH